jgi:hypothetical protein
MNEELAVPRTVVPPSDVEREACDRLATMTTDGCEAKAAQIKAASALMFEKKIEPVEVPEFVSRQNASDMATIQAAIGQMTKKPETV